jgi:hypothetical protein
MLKRTVCGYTFHLFNSSQPKFLDTSKRYWMVYPLFVVPIPATWTSLVVSEVSKADLIFAFALSISTYRSKSSTRLSLSSVISLVLILAQLGFLWFRLEDVVGVSGSQWLNFAPQHLIRCPGLGNEECDWLNGRQKSKRWLSCVPLWKNLWKKVALRGYHCACAPTCSPNTSFH